MRKIDWITIFICACAAALCYVDSSLASFLFVASSSIGLIDSIKHRVLSASLVNGIFLTLNLAFSIETLQQILF